MMKYNFAIIIISHGRPECSTYTFLREHGYTGRIIVLIDNKDTCIEEYKERYKNELIIFDKDNVELDLMDNFEGPKGIATYSRQCCINLAKELKLDYFMMIDDDLKNILFREGKSNIYKVKKLDDLFEMLLEFANNKIDILTFGTENDYIGGKNNDFNIGRGTNAYIINTNSNIFFKGRYSEDRIMPILSSQVGKLIFKNIKIQMKFDVWQPNKKVTKGGCQDIYKDDKNYEMMFYPTIASPSNTYIKNKGNKLLSATKYINVCPKIISGRYKK